VTTMYHHHVEQSRSKSMYNRTLYAPLHYTEKTTQSQTPSSKPTNTRLHAKPSPFIHVLLYKYFLNHF
jgi:hypothetical protein